MAENKDTILNEINEFVADCAKSILINNVKADEIKEKIIQLNDQIKTELKNTNNNIETKNGNILEKINASQNLISELISQNSKQSETLLTELSKTLLQTKTSVSQEITRGNTSLKNQIEELISDNNSKYQKMNFNTSSEIGNAKKEIKEMVEIQFEFLTRKSKFLPWITSGVYLVLVILITFAIITLKHLGILSF